MRVKHCGKEAGLSYGIAVTTMPSEGGEGNDCWKTDFFKLVQFDHLICCQSNEDVKWEVSGK